MFIQFETQTMFHEVKRRFKADHLGDTFKGLFINFADGKNEHFLMIIIVEDRLKLNGRLV